MRKSDKPKRGLGNTRQVRLELYRPESREVFIAGSFNDWQVAASPLNHLGESIWVVDLCLAPGRHEYRFIADGEWIDDPNAKEVVSNPHGGYNSILIVEPV